MSESGFRSGEEQIITHNALRYTSFLHNVRSRDVARSPSVPGLPRPRGRLKRRVWPRVWSRVWPRVWPRGRAHTRCWLRTRGDCTRWRGLTRGARVEAGRVVRSDGPVIQLLRRGEDDPAAGARPPPSGVLPGADCYHRSLPPRPPLLLRMGVRAGPRASKGAGREGDQEEGAAADLSSRGRGGRRLGSCPRASEAAEGGES